MNRISRWVVAVVLFASMAMPSMMSAQQYRRNFYNGARSRHSYDDRYDRGRHDRRNQGGIGPGYGALIGGAGGAALGGIFGGGAKGALIGGAAGAGVGAIAGKVHQDNKRRDYRERYDRYGRPY